MQFHVFGTHYLKDYLRPKVRNVRIYVDTTIQANVNDSCYPILKRKKNVKFRNGKIRLRVNYSSKRMTEEMNKRLKIGN